MAQSAALEPIRLSHPNDEYPQDPNKEIASILRRVVAEHKGNTNPTHHAILFLMELRADLENWYFFVNIRHETRATTQDIKDVVYLLEDFLQNVTDIDRAFEKAIQPCLELAECIKNLANTSAGRQPNGIAELRRLRTSQLKWMHRLQGRWEDLLQMARNFDESVTFRRLSEIVESAEDAVDEAWLHAKELIDSCAEDDKRRTNDISPNVRITPAPLHSMATTLQLEHTTTQGETPKLTVLHHTSDTNVSRVNTTAVFATVAHPAILRDQNNTAKASQAKQVAGNAPLTLRDQNNAAKAMQVVKDAPPMPWSQNKAG